MKICVFAQGSPEWLAWRALGIGSSDAPIIAAHHGMIEPADWMQGIDALYQEKMTGVSTVVENVVMTRGKEHEAPARAAVEARLGIRLMPLCGEMEGTPLIRVSLDGITFNRREFAEIKVPSAKVHALAKKGEVVGYYIPQIAHQALATWGHPDAWPADAVITFASYAPATESAPEDLAIVRKPASEYAVFAAELYLHELAFLKLLQDGTPPCGEEYAAAAATYLEVDQMVKAWTEKREALKEQLVAITEGQGRNSLSGEGVTTTKATRVGTVNWKKLASEYSITTSEQQKYKGKSTEFWQVRVPASKTPEKDAVQ